LLTLSQAMQEATASEPMTLEEEYENQASWRSSHDKLTFILCQPLKDSPRTDLVMAGMVDSPKRMIGDINFFLYPLDDDEASATTEVKSARECIGEVDIMVAEKTERGKGVGLAAVAAFLLYIHHHLHDIFREYDMKEKENRIPDNPIDIRLRYFMVKIKESNLASIALFKRLGFRQEGSTNYFGEIKMLREYSGQPPATQPDKYSETVYTRQAT
jgi:RimJ/RimL family protein N-acetyltransferase